METLTAALEQEHHDIDAGLEAVVAGLEAGELRHDDLGRATTALRRHIYLEEELLFPPLRAAGLLAPVLVMLREHGEIWRTLDEIESRAADDSASAGTTELCRTLLDLLERHNAKEEPIVYPQGDAVLTEVAKEELHAFMQSGAMPSGWVCSQA